MTLETKPIAEMKLGVWVNRDKLRRVLDKITFVYMIVFIAMTGFNIMGRRYGEAMFTGMMILPSVLIQLSYHKYKKMEKMENGKK